MANIQYTEEFAFYQQLKFYYDSNRGKIRSRYNDLTKKFLAYNDKNENPDAFLRLPQFEALMMLGMMHHSWTISVSRSSADYHNLVCT